MRLFPKEFRATPRRERRPGRSSGSALALVLLVMVILLPLGLALLGMGERGRIQATRLNSSLTARAAADAGLTKAVSGINDQLRDELLGAVALPAATNEGLPGVEARCSYAITGDPGTGYAAQSTGQFRTVARTVHCTLRLQGPFEYSIFTEGKLSLKSGTIVDWYNYDTGSIGNQIGTNSTGEGMLELQNGVVVNGDVVTGLGEDPSFVVKDNGATVTGGVYAQEEHNPLPPVAVPDAVLMLASSGVLTNKQEIHTSRKYDRIDLKNEARVIIKGQVILYVTGDVLFGNSAGIEIDGPNSSLTLYVGGKLVGNNGSGFNNLTRDPQRLRIYGLDSCQTISFRNSSNFYGAIYAPNANVVVDNSGDMFGAFVAGAFELKNSATLHYDASLRDVSLGDQGVHFIIDRWYED